MRVPAYLDAAFAAARAEWPDEAAEAMASVSLPPAALAALLDAGVPRGFLGQLCGAGDLALTGVEMAQDGRFAIGGPDRCWVLAVREWGVIADLVALVPHDQDRWALWRGSADFLGREMLDRALGGAVRTLRLFPTPRAWLRGGGEGVCVLDWSPGALSALRNLGPKVTLVVDPGAKDRMKAMLAHGGLPLVAEDRPDLRRAA